MSFPKTAPRYPKFLQIQNTCIYFYPETWMFRKAYFLIETDLKK